MRLSLQSPRTLGVRNAFLIDPPIVRWSIKYTFSNSQHKESLQAKRRENKKLLVTVPRVATSDWCKDIAGRFHCTKGASIEFFHNEPILLDAGVLEAVRTGVDIPGALWTRFEALPTPSSAVVASDQEQKQLTGCTGFQRLRLMFEQVYDPSHRDFLTWKHSMAQAGFYFYYYNAMIIFNVAYGPWNSAMWYHLLMAHGFDLAKAMQADDVFLNRVYHDCLMDEGLHHTPGMKTKAMKQEFIEKKFGLSKACSLRGVKAEPNNWVSWHGAFESWDPEIHARGLLIGKACMHRGSVSACEDLFSPPKSLPLILSEAKGMTLSEAKKKTRLKEVTMDEKGNKGLVAAARYIFDPDQIGGMRFIYLGSQPHNVMMKKNLAHIKDEESSLAYYVSQAKWSFLETCKETLRTRLDSLGLERCGLTFDLTSKLRKLLPDKKAEAKVDPQILHENLRAAQFYRYTFLMNSTLIGTRLVHTNGFPGRLALLTDAELAPAVLRDFVMVDIAAFHKAKETRILF